MMYNIIG